MRRSVVLDLRARHRHRRRLAGRRRDGNAAERDFAAERIIDLTELEAAERGGRCGDVVDLRGRYVSADVDGDDEIVRTVRRGRITHGPVFGSGSRSPALSGQSEVVTFRKKCHLRILFVTLHLWSDVKFFGAAYGSRYRRGPYLLVLVELVRAARQRQLAGEELVRSEFLAELVGLLVP